MNKPANIDPHRWRRERWDAPDTIYFWSGKDGPHEAFSNFAPTPFRMPAWQPELGTVAFATGEHAFQAAKVSTVDEHERVRQAATPMAAKQTARRLTLPEDWDTRRLHAVVRAKFADGPLRDLLLSTGGQLLAEDSPYDPVWGCRTRDGDYTGTNDLGRALMRVRDELRTAT